MVWAQVVEKKLLLEVQLDKRTNQAALISASTNTSLNNMINEALSNVQMEDEDPIEQGKYILFNLKVIYFKFQFICSGEFKGIRFAVCTSAVGGGPFDRAAGVAQFRRLFDLLSSQFTIDQTRAGHSGQAGGKAGGRDQGGKLRSQSQRGLPGKIHW
jgi:hypothetical protein